MLTLVKKKSCSGYINTRQRRFQSQKYYQGWRTSFHKDKGSTYQEDITLKRLWPLIRELKNIQSKTDRTMMKNRQIYIILRNFNTPLSIIDKTSTQKIAIWQIWTFSTNLTGLTPVEGSMEKVSFFSSTHGTFTRILQAMK